MVGPCEIDESRRSLTAHGREIGSRVGEAEARLRLAECLLQDHDRAGAELELNAVESNLATAAVAQRTRMTALRRALGDVQRVVPG